jgi:hypothetical protein
MSCDAWRDCSSLDDNDDDSSTDAYDDDDVLVSVADTLLPVYEWCSTFSGLVDEDESFISF